jgi:hypothetical protein
MVLPARLDVLTLGEPVVAVMVALETPPPPTGLKNGIISP